MKSNFLYQQGLARDMVDSSLPSNHLWLLQVLHLGTLGSKVSPTPCPQAHLIPGV